MFTNERRKLSGKLSENYLKIIRKLSKNYPKTIRPKKDQIIFFMSFNVFEKMSNTKQILPLYILFLSYKHFANVLLVRATTSPRMKNKHGVN